MVRFAGFELDPRNAVLRKDGTDVHLSAQPFKALVFLASRPGELVSRDELRQALWGTDTVVDFEHGLNTCIRQIRTALGDQADAPTIIETVPRLGYRFKATVEPLAERRSRQGSAVASAAVLAVLLAGIGWSLAHRAAQPNPEAVALYVKGEDALEGRTDGGHVAARQFFDRAIALDPNYAEPHAALARLYVDVPPTPSVGPLREAIPRAMQEASRAIFLSPTHPEPHLAMALVRMADGDRAGVESEYARATKLAPQSALVHQENGLWLALEGRFDEALDEARLAERLDPLSPRSYWVTTAAFRFARRCDEAIVEAQKGLAINPSFGPIHHALGICYEEKGDFSRAFEEYRQDGRPTGNLGHAYAVAGRIADAREVLGWLENRWATSHVGAGEVAQVYIGLRDINLAFEWLFRAADDGEVPNTLKVASVWDPLRSDPRFAQLWSRSVFK